jgi:hypothetical protein
MTSCECPQKDLVFRSVSDIDGGDPVDRCFGPLVCNTGTYDFDSQGRLRAYGFDTPWNSLLWDISPASGHDYDVDRDGAGTVTMTAEGLYVNDLCGLGQALLEPIDACTP